MPREVQAADAAAAADVPALDRPALEPGVRQRDDERAPIGAQLHVGICRSTRSGLPMERPLGTPQGDLDEVAAAPVRSRREQAAVGAHAGREWCRWSSSVPGRSSGGERCAPCQRRRARRTRPSPRTTSEPAARHEADAGHFPAVRATTQRPAPAGPATSTTLIVPSAWPARAAGRRRSARRWSRLGPPRRSAGQSPGAGEVPDEDRAVEPGGVERPAVAGDLQAPIPLAWPDSVSVAAPAPDVPHDRVAVVARGDQGAAVRREARPGHGPAVAARRPAHLAGTQVDEADGAVLLAERRGAVVGAERDRALVPAPARGEPTSTRSTGFSVRASRTTSCWSETVSTRRPSRVPSTGERLPARA